MDVIIAHEKHDDNRIIRAEDGTIGSAALLLLKERIADGYWYDEDDEEHGLPIATAAIEKGGAAAWEFLESRRDYEYEWVEERRI